jgi:hypothetical protein
MRDDVYVREKERGKEGKNKRAGSKELNRGKERKKTK